MAAAVRPDDLDDLADRRWSTSRPASSRSWPASAATTPARSWLPDGSLVYVSDADGWFQVVRRSPDGRDRIVLTDGEREHGEPSGGVGYAPLPSPDGSRVVHIEVHDGLVDLVVRSLGDAAAAQARPRPAAQDAAHGRGGHARPSGSRPGTASGGPSAGCRTGRGSRPSARARPGRRTCGCCPSRASRPREPGRARSPTPAPPSWRRPSHPGRVPAGERIAIKARDGLRVEGTLWRPSGATGKRGGKRVPTIIYPHGGPTWQAYRSLPAVQAAAGARGLRVPRRRLPRLHRLRARVPPGQPRRVGPRRRPRPDRRRALGAGAALVGRAARDLRRVVRRLHGPVRPRRGARDVRGRHRPLRRLRDRRELPPRRPAGTPGPAQDDGHARRPGPDRALPARLAGLPRRAHRGAAAASCTAARTSASSR